LLGDAAAYLAPTALNTTVCIVSSCRAISYSWNFHRWLITWVYPKNVKFRYSFICQDISTRRQRSDLFSLRVKLRPVTTSLTTQK